METKFNKKKVAVLLAISSLALLSGCGKSSGGGDIGSIGGGITGPGTYAGGCIPLSSAQTIAFSAVNAYFDPYSLPTVKAGALPADPVAFHPYAETVGTVTIGGSPINQPSQVYLAGLSQYNGTKITINVTPTGQGLSTMNGQIELNPTFQQYLLMLANNTFYNMSGFPYPNSVSGGQYFPVPYNTWSPQVAQTATATCVSGVGFVLQRKPPYNDLGYGTVYLYMNGQAHGVALNF